MKYVAVLSSTCNTVKSGTGFTDVTESNHNLLWFEFFMEFVHNNKTVENTGQFFSISCISCTTYHHFMFLRCVIFSVTPVRQWCSMVPLLVVTGRFATEMSLQVGLVYQRAWRGHSIDLVTSLKR